MINKNSQKVNHVLKKPDAPLCCSVCQTVMFPVRLTLNEAQDVGGVVFVEAYVVTHSNQSAEPPEAMRPVSRGGMKPKSLKSCRPFIRPTRHHLISSDM